MSNISEDQVQQAPVGEVQVIYLGPVAPHWEVRSGFGYPKLVESFQDRIGARLILLPPHDPQFILNHALITRNSARENFLIPLDFPYVAYEYTSHLYIFFKPLLQLPVVLF